MHSLNDFLDVLRELVPGKEGEDKSKITKCDTLERTTNYIFALNETLKLMDQLEGKEPKESYVEDLDLS